MFHTYRILRRRLLGCLGAPVRPEPVCIDIEPTVRCNLRCSFCLQSTWNRRAPDMTPDLFRRVLDSFPGLDEIKLQGMGEPLLNRDFFLFVRMAGQRSIRVKTYTNGTLLTPETVSALVDSGIDEVFVSFDHPDPETLEKLRPGLDFRSLTKGIQRLNAATRDDHPLVTAWTLALPQLSGRIDDHIARARELGFSRIIYQRDITTWGKTRVAPDQSAHDDLLEEIGTATGRNPGIQITTVSTNSFCATRPCPWPFYHCYVTAEGRIQPCCILSDPGLFSMGDLSRTPLYRIWNGRAYFRLRRSILDTRPIPQCRGCYGPA